MTFHKSIAQIQPLFKNQNTLFDHLGWKYVLFCRRMPRASAGTEILYNYVNVIGRFQAAGCHVPVQTDGRQAPRPTAPLRGFPAFRAEKAENGQRGAG